ncbi:MAG: WG repeat-containing protein [Oscillospiraceae bacterium]|nr:WG repeat-containing protein [Oscillospiraceae bacterium]
MNKKIYIPIILTCTAILGAAWYVAVNTSSTTEKQLLLINEAVQMMESGIYIRAVPLLEEAANYDAAYTAKAEKELKRAYLELMENRGFTRRYTTLLEKQLSRKDVASEVFIEAAEFYLNSQKIGTALTILKDGLKRINCPEIEKLYEKSRYAYELSWVRYDEVTAMFDGTAGVLNEGKWGIARTDGTLIIPNKYDKISTFFQGIAIVREGGEIYAIDEKTNRLAVPEQAITDFKNLSGGRVALKTDEGWRRASSDLESGAKVFEDIGMYSEGFVSAKTDGKWGVIDLGTDWLIAPKYEGIVMDELGRSVGQTAVFVKDGDVVKLFSGGKWIGEEFDDARPFSNEGYASVKKNGKWGFIDTTGELKIDYKFDDALSFSGHLAAVREGEHWGFINLQGDIVIAAEFYDVKCFSQGSAPVKTDRGWQFLTLIEFKGGLTL